LNDKNGKTAKPPQSRRYIKNDARRASQIKARRAIKFIRKQARGRLLAQKTSLPAPKANLPQ
jgi:hypothetical protein